MISGIKFPLQFYAGRVVVSGGQSHIKESVIQIIGTSKNEYLLKPNLGSRISERIFDSVNVAALVEVDIRDTLNRYEPRIDLVSTSANLSESSTGMVIILVRFRIKGQSEIVDLNFSLGR